MKQGSVLSPALFLLVLDPFLRELQTSWLGLSINNFYAGGFLHADDVRTLASSKELLEAQVAIVKRLQCGFPECVQFYQPGVSGSVWDLILVEGGSAGKLIS